MPLTPLLCTLSEVKSKKKKLFYKIVWIEWLMQGWEVIRAEHLNQLWKEKYDEWLKRPKSKSKKKRVWQKKQRDKHNRSLVELFPTGNSIKPSKHEIWQNVFGRFSFNLIFLLWSKNQGKIVSWKKIFYVWHNLDVC